MTAPPRALQDGSAPSDNQHPRPSELSSQAPQGRVHTGCVMHSAHVQEGRVHTGCVMRPPPRTYKRGGCTPGASCTPPARTRGVGAHSAPRIPSLHTFLGTTQGPQATQRLARKARVVKASEYPSFLRHAKGTYEETDQLPAHFAHLMLRTGFSLCCQPPKYLLASSESSKQTV